MPIIAGTMAALALTLNVPNSAAPLPSNSYIVNVTVTDSSGQPSQSLTLPLTVIQYFTLGSLTPATQTINTGQSASYNFSVLPVGTSFANAVDFSCAGGPVSSLCSFTPSSVTPGSSAAAVVMTISTTSSAAGLSPLGPGHVSLYYAFGLTLPCIALLGSKRLGAKHARLRLLPSLLGLFLLAVLLSSCGGGGINGGSSSSGQLQGTQPGTYVVTVTGTSGALSHQTLSTTILIVNP